MLLGGMSSSRSPRPLPRSPTTQLHGDRLWQGPGGGNEFALHGQVPEHLTPQAAGAQHFAMDAGEDVGEAPAAGRPAPLLEVLPQEQVQERIAEQIVDPVPVVPLLHAFVPQMVEQLVDILAPLDFRAQSSVRRRRHTSWWKCRRLSPILRYYSGLWSRTLPFQFVVVEGETSIFKVFFPDRVQQRRIRLWNAFLSRLWSRSSTFLFPLEALQIFALDRVHPQLRTLQLLGSTLRMSLLNGFFALFLRKKKVQLSPGTWVRECPGTSAHPRRLLMARALGWTTTRVRSGRCSRIRCSARGGTARARTRRGSAELGCAGAGGRLCAHAETWLLAVLRPG